MLQQRKKDYFQRIIEEFFAKLQELYAEGVDVPQSEKRALLNEGFNFYRSLFEIDRSDSAVLIIDKLKDNDLVEHYVKLLKTEYEIMDIKYEDNLLKALSLIEYLQRNDTCYSWERTILQEDILRLLDDIER